MSPPPSSDSKEWYLNGAPGRTLEFRARFPIHCQDEHPNMIDLVLQGTTIEKGKIAVFNNAHAYLIYHSLLSEAKRDAKEAWANPFPTTGPSDEQVALAISHAEVTRKREEAAAIAKFVAAGLGRCHRRFRRLRGKRNAS